MFETSVWPGTGGFFACYFLRLTAALEQGRAHHKPKDKENQEGDNKDEEEHLGDTGSSGGDPGEAEQAGNDRNDKEK